MAGVLFGCNNFLLSQNSELGMAGAYIFCIGAIALAFIYNCYYAMQSKKETGSFWTVEKSNLYKIDDDGKTTLNKANLVGLVIRTCLVITQ